MADLSQFKQIENVVWEIEPDFEQGMNIPARVIAVKELLKNMDQGAIDQLTNMAHLPGVVDYTFAMPDAHWGYGAPVGGVFATDPDNKGIISPGAIGFDINCGMRLIRTSLEFEQVKPKLERLIDDLFATIPTGVGASGAVRELSEDEMKQVMTGGMQFCIDKGGGWK
ncbi:MAG: RNA-splicing ligase RtcB, partial [Parcubacteria group bacterium QH_9_35_7]